MGLKWFLIDYHYNCDTTKLQSKFFRLYYFVYKTQICFAAPNKNISFDSTVCWPLIYTDHLSLLTSSFWCDSGLHAAYKTNTKNASSYICVSVHIFVVVNLHSSLNLVCATWILAWSCNTTNSRNINIYKIANTVWMLAAKVIWEKLLNILENT